MVCIQVYLHFHHQATLQLVKHSLQRDVEQYITNGASKYKSFDEIDSEFQYRFDQERFLLETST
ncbi:unnamed protein product [Schistosoma curassoni]|uniref:Transposase n=1 Tax=Schistosoma curassoni TaxID=6186 RepID=A0A183KAN0_9TREM|nr:unnamed protein product [Schistosoma curassoni]